MINVSGAAYYNIQVVPSLRKLEGGLIVLKEKTTDTLALSAKRLQVIFSDLHCTEAVHSIIEHTFTLIALSNPVVPAYIIAARKVMDFIKISFLFIEGGELFSYFAKKTPGKAPKLEEVDGKVVSLDPQERLATAGKTMAERNWSKKPFKVLAYASFAVGALAGFVELGDKLGLYKLATVASFFGKIPYVGPALVAGAPLIFPVVGIAAYTFFTLDSLRYCFAAMSDSSKDLGKGLLDLATRVSQLTVVLLATFTSIKLAPLIAIGGIISMGLYLARHIYIQERQEMKAEVQERLMNQAKIQLEAITAGGV